MRFLVVGAGAVGSLVGGRLAAVGHDVTLVAREWLAGAVADNGLRLNISGEALYVPDIAAVTSVRQAVLEFGPFDLALFTMKSYDTEAGIREVQAAVDGPLSVLSLQNGVGNEELLTGAVGADHVIAGVITAPAEIAMPGVVRASSGGIGLAVLEAGTPVGPVASAFQTAGFDTEIYADWRALKWSKLLLNLLGNATPAILDWPAERVFADARLFDLEWRAWHEALDVMRAQDIPVVALPGYRLPWAVRVLHWIPRRMVQAILRRAVVRGRSGKMPSLHIDLEAGRRRSEVTVLNGAVVDAGRQLGQPTPVNDVLTETVVDIARGKVDWDTFRGRPDRLLAAVEAKQERSEPVR